MKVLMLCHVAMLIAVTAMAEGNSAKENSSTQKQPQLSLSEKQARMDRVYAKFGGRIRKPGTGIGCVGFVDAKSGVSASDVKSTMSTIATQLRHEQKILEVERLNGLPSRSMVEKLGLNVGVFIVSDDQLPVMIVAPEDRWALVNVAKLRKGLKNDPVSQAVFSVRCRGELQRAFAYACGAGSSQYNDNLMAITEIEQIDSINTELTVSDTMLRCQKYLNSINVKAPVMVTYGTAVREGWAPAPTNDIQKAVWDKVHAMPSDPIKIKPETRKVSE